MKISRRDMGGSQFAAYLIGARAARRAHDRGTELAPCPYSTISSSARYHAWYAGVNDFRNHETETRQLLKEA